MDAAADTPQTPINAKLAVASLAALVITLVHVVVGGAETARPLLDGDLPDVARATAYLCWHAITAVMALMAAGFGYAAFAPNGRPYARAAAVTAGMFVLVNVAVIIGLNVSPWLLPQWVMFGPLGALGFWALGRGGAR